MDKKPKGPSWGGCPRALRNAGECTLKRLVLEHFSSAEASLSLASPGAALCCSMTVSPSKVGPREWCDRKAISAASHRGLPRAPSLPETLAKEDAGST